MQSLNGQQTRSRHEGETPGRRNVVVVDATVLDAVAVGTPTEDMAAGNAVAGERSGRGKRHGGGGCRARGKLVLEKDEATGSQ